MTYDFPPCDKNCIHRNYITSKYAKECATCKHCIHNFKIPLWYVPFDKLITWATKERNKYKEVNK